MLVACTARLVSAIVVAGMVNQNIHRKNIGADAVKLTEFVRSVSVVDAFFALFDRVVIQIWCGLQRYGCGRVILGQ